MATLTSFPSILYYLEFSYITQLLIWRIFAAYKLIYAIAIDVLWRACWVWQRDLLLDVNIEFGHLNGVKPSSCNPMCRWQGIADQQMGHPLDIRSHKLLEYILASSICRYFLHLCTKVAFGNRKANFHIYLQVSNWNRLKLLETMLRNPHQVSVKKRSICYGTNEFSKSYLLLPVTVGVVVPTL